MIRRFSLVCLAIGWTALVAWSAPSRAQVAGWDDATAAAISAAIERTPSLSGSSITVDCFAGTVMLTGLVPSFDLRGTVEATVQRVAGNARIIDELNQDPDRTAMDASRDAVIQSTLETTLAQYGTSTPPLVTARGRVYDGIVYLLGAVSDPSMNDIVQSSIMALPGVHAVVAHLTLETPPTPPPSPSPAAIAAVPETIQVSPAPVRHHRAMSAKPAYKGGAPSARTYGVQLASEPSETEALAAWHRRQSANGDLLGSLTPTITRVDLGALGIRFRLKAGPLPDLAAAQALCADLAKRRVNCMVVIDRSAMPEPAPPVEAAPAVSPPPSAIVKPHPVTIVPVVSPAVSPIAAPRPKPRIRAAALAPAHPKSKAEARFYVQLASRSTDAAARAYWSDQQGHNGDLLKGLSPVVTPADLGPKGTMYRLKTGPFATRAGAQALCAKLGARQLDCLVVRAAAP